VRPETFIRPVDPLRVAAHLGRALRVLGPTFALPGLVSLGAREWVQAGVFAAVTAVLSAVAWWLGRDPPRQMRPAEGLVVAALSYLVLALAGAAAFLPELGFLDALFEAMSAFTSTGLTVVTPEELPSGLVFFRAWAQWLGGLGIVVISLMVLHRPGQAARTLYASSEMAKEAPAPGAGRSARVVVRAYGLLTLGGVMALVAAGMGPWDALLHGLTAISTAGFTPRSDSMASWTGREGVLGVMAALMVLGAVSIPLYPALARRGWRALRDDPQVPLLLALCLAGAAVMIPAAGWTRERVTSGAFHAVSAATTSGFSMTPGETWTDGSRLAAICLMVSGGSLASTAGGLKLLRVIALAKLVRLLVARALLPREAVLPLRVGGANLSGRDLQFLAGFTAVYWLVLAAGALLLTLDGHPAERALFESASALGTVGLSAGVTSPDMSAFGKLVLTVEMWAGRLEVVPLLVLLYPWTWLREGARS